MSVALICLKNVSDVNNFEEATELSLVQGNPETLYFRIVNHDRAVGDGIYERFIYPTSPTVSLTIKFNAIDTNGSISLPATLAFPNDDRSIYSVPILPSCKIAYGSVQGVLTVGANTYKLELLTELTQKSNDPSGKFYC